MARPSAGTDPRPRLTPKTMLKFHVPTVVCEGCLETITQAILQTDPTATVQADLATKTFTVTTQTDASVLREAIAATGHQVS